MLKDDEKRLRQIVAEFERDPEKIEQESLDSVKEVIQRIYSVLDDDAKAQNGALANNIAIWDSLKTKYLEIFKATSKLRPIFKLFDELNQNHGHPPAGTELDDTADRAFNRRHEWLAKVSEFQRDFSAFYNEVIQPGEKKSP